MRADRLGQAPGGWGSIDLELLRYTSAGSIHLEPELLRYLWPMSEGAGFLDLGLALASEAGADLLLLQGSHKNCIPGLVRQNSALAVPMGLQSKKF